MGTVSVKSLKKEVFSQCGNLQNLINSLPGYQCECVCRGVVATASITECPGGFPFLPQPRERVGRLGSRLRPTAPGQSLEVSLGVCVCLCLLVCVLSRALAFCPPEDREEM